MTVERGRGWAAVAGLALVTAATSVVQPVLLIFVPLALLFFALPPRRPILIALGAFIGWLTFGAPPQGELWYFERGWVLLLGAWFVVAVVVLPGRAFLTRGLAAVVATTLTAAGLLLIGSNGLAELDVAVAERLQSQASQMLTALAQWPDAARFFRAQSEEALAATSRLFPSLLALASTAGLGVAWWAFARLGRGETRPLGAVREFRFSNELVWVLIAALVLLVLPLNGIADRIGENLLVYMAALYALRGLGVVLMLTGAAWPVALGVGVVSVMLLSKLVMAATILVGLSDTWLDLRARREAPTSPGS